MLTKRENMLETIRGGSPDRFVNQYEALKIMSANPIMDPQTGINLRPKRGGEPVADGWGVYRAFPEGQPAPYPLHGEHTLCDDIEEWAEKIVAPSVRFSEDAWEPAIAAMRQIDRNEYFAAVVVAPGIFENLHLFQGMEDAMANFIAEPELTHELVDYLVEFELDVADQYIRYLQPDAVFHHDDWGSKLSTFLSPEMFAEFIMPAYRKIYGYYKENGVEIVVHHSDSFARTLIPSMIEMGIDVWQGTMESNDINACIDAYGGQISFMGGIDSELVDYPEWTPEIVESVVREKVNLYGGHSAYFIPCITQGGAFSTYPGVYDTATDVIKRINCERFGFSFEEL